MSTTADRAVAAAPEPREIPSARTGLVFISVHGLSPSDGTVVQLAWTSFGQNPPRLAGDNDTGRVGRDPPYLSSLGPTSKLSTRRAAQCLSEGNIPCSMEVVAVSAALPQWQDVNGKRTFTSIVRKPLKSGVIQVSADGIEQNKTAVHEGPVYAFFAHHYDYWCEKQGVDRAQWDWCHWGENVTFRCTGATLFNETTIRLGDVWNVGSEVQLEVCGARVPCFKLSWRCGQKDSWLKPLADSGFCGVYLRVLKTGQIRVGDKATLVKQRPDTFDCATITRAAFEGSLKTRDTMNLLADNKWLLGQLRLFFARKVRILDDQARQGKGAWEGWRSFRPAKMVDEGGGVASFYLKPLDKKPLATFSPGQFLTVRLPDGDTRSWSISDWPQDPDSPDCYRITIKKAKQASRWMHSRCTLETVLDVRSPSGTFFLDVMPMFLPRQIYLSAGVGITPVFTMMKTHSRHPSMQRTDSIWVHVCRNSNELPFRDELDQLPRDLKRVFFFTAPRSEEEQGKDYHVRGRPDLEAMRNLIAPSYLVRLSKASLETEGRMSSVYICGPAAFEESMRATLAGLDVPPPLIHSEKFAGDGLAELPDLEEATVFFTKSKIEAKWTVKDPVSILELAEAAGLKPEYGCRTGVCGACSVRLICGTTAGGMQTDGNVFVCSARPSTPRIEIEI